MICALCVKDLFCPYCNSENVVCIGHHNNRRKKFLIYLMQCKNCKKRYTEEGDKNLYDHAGNAIKKNHLCHICRNKLDNDTEKIIGTCFDCIVSGFGDFESYFESYDDYMFFLMDYEEYKKEE